jgi:hypothetical protein
MYDALSEQKSHAHWDWAKRDSIPYSGRNVLPHHHYQHTQRTEMAIIFGKKLPEREADHLSESSTDTKKRWSFTSIAAIRLHNVAIKLYLVESPEGMSTGHKAGL